MAKIARYILRPFIVSTLLISLALATFTGYDSFVGDGECPEFAPADYGTPLVAEECFSRHLYDNKKHTHEEYWEALRPTLRILDEINPQVAGWVRRKERDENLQFVASEIEMAKFDLYTRKLSICHRFFIESEKDKAAMLCHEYRHSKQNFAKVARYILSFAFHKTGKPEIIENDADLYERQARSALSGTP